MANLINTGDHATFFVGSYQRLAEAYIDPWPVFDRVQIDRVERRPWLEERVDRFLSEQDRGYLVIEAPAGLGKSTFLAQLVKQRGWMHHFVELAPGDAGVIPARRNLAAQVIRAYELSTFGSEAVVPTEAAARPDYLATLLRDAAKRSKERERIVVVVDGLDEAGRSRAENVLGLPAVLPAGVYFVVSQRPVPVTLDVSAPLRIERIDPDAKDNELDLRRFLERAAKDDRLARALKEADPPLSEQEFVDTLIDRSGGIWVYVHYVLSEIEQRKPPDIRALPSGLWRYYFRFWTSWRDTDPAKWWMVWLPLLATLAAIQEDAPLDLVFTLAGLEPSPEVADRLRRHWLPFLAVSRDAEPRYRLYHASLAEFLQGRSNHEQLTADQKQFSIDLADAVRAAHARIIRRYLTQWGDLDNGLHLLAVDADAGDLDDGYGLRSLPVHLEVSGRTDDLHRLLACEHRAGDTNRPANTWYLAHDRAGNLASYLVHVAIARGLAGQAAEPAQGIERSGLDLGLEIRYALVTASIASQAALIPAALLGALVSAGIWRLAQALAYVGKIPDVAVRSSAYTVIAKHLDQTKRTRVLEQSLAAARGIGGEWQRAKALAALAPQLPPELLAEALAAARGIGDEQSRAEALAALAIHQPELLRDALAAARGIGDERTRADALAALAPQLPPELLAEALAAARGIGDERTREEAVAALAPQLPPELLAEALAAAAGIRDEESRAWALVALAPQLPPELLGEALAAARGLRDEKSRAWALVALAPGLPPELLGEALAAARGIGGQWQRAEALAALAIHQPELLGEALVAARGIRGEKSRAWALVALAPQLPPELLGEVLEEAVAAARGIGDERTRADALAALAIHQPELVREALAAVRGIGDEWTRAEALAALAPQLPPELLGEALAAARGIGDEQSRGSALAALAALVSSNIRIVDLLDGLTRPTALSVLSAAVRCIDKQGGREALHECARAITDVGRWWP